MPKPTALKARSQAFQRLKAELQRAFASPDESFGPLDAEIVIRRGLALREIAPNS